jgi:hypothetical protein
MQPIRLLVGLAVVVALAAPRPAEAIPAFARKYGVSCQMCHDPVPRLNAAGEAFAANGFQFAPGACRRRSARSPSASAGRCRPTSRRPG